MSNLTTQEVHLLFAFAEMNGFEFSGCTPIPASEHNRAYDGSFAIRDVEPGDPRLVWSQGRKRLRPLRTTTGLMLVHEPEIEGMRFNYTTTYSASAEAEGFDRLAYGGNYLGRDPRDDALTFIGKLALNMVKARQCVKLPPEVVESGRLPDALTAMAELRHVPLGHKTHWEARPLPAQKLQQEAAEEAAPAP